MSAFTVAIGGKADMGCALHMSAFDPKRTSRLSRTRRSVVCHFSLAAWSQSARLWQLHRRVRGSTCSGASSSRFSVAQCSVAVRGARAAARADAAHRRAHARHADDAEYQTRMAAFLQGLQQLGWSDGRNVRIDTRWAAGDANLIRKYVAELIALAPDVILAPGSTSWARCYKRPAPCRLYSRPSSIRSAPASLIAWRGPAATPPVSSRSNTA